MAAQQPINLDEPASPAAQIEQCFEAVFYQAYRTRLIGGAEEPEYRAHLRGTRERDAIIRYRQDFAASALHETAHWCIAGEQRRRQDDYGYWYSPDGRDEATQALFEKVEARPQALEYLLSVCCDLPFRLSVDNLALPEWDQSAFSASVLQQFERLSELDQNTRAAAFADALARRFRGMSWRQCWLEAIEYPAACFGASIEVCDE